MKGKYKGKRSSAAPVAPTQYQGKPASTPSKGPGCLTLLIMGGVAFTLLHSCDSADSDAETIYTNVAECAADGIAMADCQAGYDAAQKKLAVEMPHFTTADDCQNAYGLGNCHYDTATNQFMPALAGFMIARALSNRNDSSWSSFSGGGYSSSYSRPFYRSQGSDALRVPNSSDTFYKSSGSRYSSSHASTYSRGGYGHSSSARGSWGG